MPEDGSDTRNLGALTAAAVRLLRLSHFTIEQAPDMVLWLDAEGRIRRANEAACRTTGLARDDLLGRRLQDLIDGDGEGVFAGLWRPDATSVSATQECQLRVAGGETLPVDIAVSYVEFDAAPYNCAFIRDITERKRAEGALREALEQVERYKNRLEAENVYLQGEIKLEHNFDEIIGTHSSLRAALSRVEQVAESDATVLILGESGTGKELVARAIHHLGPRRERPLVKVNCAALPANLIESELFGHEKGAFTGALARRIGRFELADQGTLFLDEIGDLPLQLQAKLLRVLQEGEYERVGEARTRSTDVRVIAATNQDLRVAVDQGSFRPDLYYRLNVFPIELPPLRERIEDVPLLAQHFVHKYAGKMGRRLQAISQRMLDSLIAYPWPGNVRELENVIERAVILHRGVTTTLDEPLAVPQEPAPSQVAATTLPEMERAMILEALSACNWVIGGKKGAARRLDMAPSTLRERMQRYGITRPS